VQGNNDHYEVYYADKLWNLLPAVYRASDSTSLETIGPLRELINRIGAQAAVMRRSMDRLWEDQSIESCDDWIIPYIGDLLATNIIPILSPRNQRLDVAKTIYYRRRKGTVAVLEELATDITGWEVRIVEFFRRIGRTRHHLDPMIGAQDNDRALLYAEGVVGRRTGTPLGGYADLRNVYGASKVNSAFDEYAHTVDVRRGREMVGWHNIPRLGVFIWRLYSFPTGEMNDRMISRPVPDARCANRYSFDPTGREIPLFAGSSKRFGDAWVSPEEWELPAPISTPLYRAETANLYATDDAYRSLGVYRDAGLSVIAAYNLLAPSDVAVLPERGLFTVQTPQANDDVLLRSAYHYGFSAPIGAGFYDRRVLRSLHPDRATVAPVSVVDSGGSLTAHLINNGTLILNDSLTYYGIADVGAATPITALTIRGANFTRPVIRMNGGEWAFIGAQNPTGDGRDGTLMLEGLLISGCDVVLRGYFDQVTLRCCTFDPGMAGDGAVYAQAVDGQDLRPCRIIIEGQVRRMLVERCIAAQIRTRSGGAVEHLYASDSILQAIRTADYGAFTAEQVIDPLRLVLKLKRGSTAEWLTPRLSAATRTELDAHPDLEAPPDALIDALIADLNTLIGGGVSIYDATLYGEIRTARTRELQHRADNGEALAAAEWLELNRRLLEEAIPEALSDLVLALSDGVVELERCTLLNAGYAHRLEASECILNDLFTADDTQHGCVRFSAWAEGSVLPRHYESVRIPAGAPLFASRIFGQPDYSRLLPNVDAVILDRTPRDSITRGAENGAEMGAFAAEMTPLKEDALRIKFGEYMPLGLVPVLINVT
jgi:hypothetical protein